MIRNAMDEIFVVTIYLLLAFLIQISNTISCTRARGYPYVIYRDYRGYFRHLI